MTFDTPVLPIRPGDKEAEQFQYEGYDILTLEMLVEREYEIPEPQTPGEVIGFYAEARCKRSEAAIAFAHSRQRFETSSHARHSAKQSTSKTRRFSRQ